MSELTLDELIGLRSNLTTALAVHEPSLRAFHPDGAVSFRILTREELSESPAGKPSHMTSTASCFESLADQTPAWEGRFPATGSRASWGDLASKFADRALDTPGNEWKSDGAADVYCRVRTLPMAIRYADVAADTSERATAASSRLIEAFGILNTGRPVDDLGLGEMALQDGEPHAPAKGQLQYPANAFHAYWGLKAQRRYDERRAVAPLPPLPEDHTRRVEQNAAWANAAIGRHVAFLNAGSRRGDAQQLAFAVLADLQSKDRKLAPSSAQYDLYEAAIHAFFSAQEPSGRWPRSLPLFHYPGSGNAYCYTYETLTELLRPALPREEGRVFRSLLEPNLGPLLAAWDYAMSTRVPLDESGNAFGWCSTHHVGRDEPEAWATAEVFSFGQLLRCVAGHVVAERAGNELGARRPEYADRGAAQKEFAARGRTWAPDGWSVGRTMAAMFLHPMSAKTGEPHDTRVLDPDAAVIGRDDARSAVLFGPPGTGKTSIVEALAGAISWQYIEVLASDFLRDGVDGVPARADRIFELLMQVDRCVVLFDEIDELIQDRSREDSDPFGRFLTTSMLPKLAKLWKQRRVMFFVATNHVSRADAAITRTSRFDARIFVAPPGLQVKRALLEAAFGDDAPEFEDDDVRSALAQDDEARKSLSEEKQALAVLPLLRYDQVPELIRRLRLDGGTPSTKRLLEALADMRQQLLRHEWVPAESNGEQAKEDPADRLRNVYLAYRHDISHDFSRRRLLRIDGEAADPPGNVKEVEADGNGSVRLYSAPDELEPLMNGESLVLPHDGATVSDGSLLWWK